MAKIDGLRDALVKDDAGEIKSATSGLPSCPDLPPMALSVGQASPRDKGCLSDLANALGSQKGFVSNPPDQAAATTVAVVLLRDAHGDWITQVDTWLGALRTGQGSGFDALRLAVARRMEEAAPLVGRAIENEKDALPTMKAIVAAVPGACPTYGMVAGGADPMTIPFEFAPDHSACVQKDLQRREGPGGRYGTGIFRALEGSITIWRETERALRQGISKAASPATTTTLEKKLAVIEAATQKNSTKKLDDTTSATLRFLGDIHAEAGVKILKDRDAGDAGDAAKDATPD
jgi:hypothetical protein